MYQLPDAPPSPLFWVATLLRPGACEEVVQTVYARPSVSLVAPRGLYARWAPGHLFCFKSGPPASSPAGAAECKYSALCGSGLLSDPRAGPRPHPDDGGDGRPPKSAMIAWAFSPGPCQRADAHLRLGGSALTSAK